MARKSLFMETTAVAASRSSAQVVDVLVESGATSVAMDYGKGKITGLRWVMAMDSHQMTYAMPARVDPVYRQLCDRRRDGEPYSDREKKLLRDKAERVAWRQLFRWVEAQLAMIRTGMATGPEVFLPYLYSVKKDQTLYEMMRTREFKMLEGA